MNMKTSIKIALLILFSVAAIGAILIFAKTQMDPPSQIKMVDQYAASLSLDCQNMQAVNNFSESRALYVSFNDKIERFITEKVMSNPTADRFRLQSNAIYGQHLTEYGYSILRQSEWSGTALSNILDYIRMLSAMRLSSGEKAISEEMGTALGKLRSIIDDYHTALNLSKSGSFNGVADASSKIASANAYKSKDFLKNNAELVAALNALPGRVAASHYNYVEQMVERLNSYTTNSKEVYLSTVVPQVDAAINDYKKVTIYGSQKRSINDLENEAVTLVTTAMNYYNGN